MRRSAAAWLSVAPILATIAGCTSHSSVPAAAGSSVAENPLATCHPVTTKDIEDSTDGRILTSVLHPPLCQWTTTGSTDLTYLWSTHDSATTEEQSAAEKGYQFTVITLQNGPIQSSGWVESNPADPASCTVWGVENNGLFDWNVRRATADPCTTAVRLADLTIQLSP